MEVKNCINYNRETKGGYIMKVKNCINYDRMTKVGCHPKIWLRMVWNDMLQIGAKNWQHMLGCKLLHSLILTQTESWRK